MPVYLQIESWIESLIFNQVIPAHTPLPAVSALAQQCGASALTVHKAYRRLKKRGLVYAIVGNGTFVAPVEHNRFVGLLIHREVLALAATSPTILLHLDSLHRELAAKGYVDRIVIDNNSRHVGQRMPISSDAMAVLEDPSLQALIALTHEGSDELFKLLKRRRIPSIGFGAELYDGYDSVVEPRQDDYIASALRYLREQGLVDVAVMYYDDPETLDSHRVGYLQKVGDQFAAESITMRPDWIVGVSDVVSNFGGFHAFEHLWSCSQRPRALIIVDDVVAHSAMTAIMVRHVRVPDDLRVCVLANSGSALTFPRAWTRWEFDTAGICRRIVAAIKSLEAGEPAPKILNMIPEPVREPARPALAERRSHVSFRTAGQILSMATT
jgi:DNA-binding transcriptional regulator YhcF (GntR family)